MAALIPGQTKKALPLKLLLPLVMHQRPWVGQAEDAIWDASVTCPFPLLSYPILSIAAIATTTSPQGCRAGWNFL